MVGWTDFRTAQPCLLRENGDVVDLDDAPVDPARAKAVVLSRALCWFDLFRRPTSLSTAAGVRAARLYAEAHAPIPGAHFALYRSPAGIGVWYWDPAKVQALLGDSWRYAAASVVPEGAIQHPGEGWRHARTADGYDAQYWSGQALIATLWRRRPFTDAQWAAFVSSVPGATEPAPVHAPSSLAPALLAPGAWARARILPPLGWRDVERGALGAAFVAVLIVVFFQGQALKHASAARAEMTALARINAAGADDKVGEAARTDLALVRAFAATTPRPDHVLATADALHVFHTFGVTVKSWRVDGETLRAEVADADAATLPDLAAALEGEARLAHVTPQRDAVSRTTTFTIDVPPFESRRRKGGKE